MRHHSTIDADEHKPSAFRRFIRTTLLVAVLLLVAWIILKLVIGMAFTFLIFVFVAAIVVGVVWAFAKL